MIEGTRAIFDADDEKYAATSAERVQEQQGKWHCDRAS